MRRTFRSPITHQVCGYLVLQDNNDSILVGGSRSWQSDIGWCYPFVGNDKTQSVSNHVLTVLWLCYSDCGHLCHRPASVLVAHSRLPNIGRIVGDLRSPIVGPSAFHVVTSVCRKLSLCAGATILPKNVPFCRAREWKRCSVMSGMGKRG